MSAKYPIILVGERYGRLVVIGDETRIKTAKAVLCRCDCGNQKMVFSGNLRYGFTKSCGCYERQNRAEQIENRRTHGHAGLHKKTREYGSWRAMRTRCNNKKSTVYAYYGGRGIKICERWDSFENFLEGMGPRPIGKSLDRIDNNAGYCKENCRWATATEQTRNSRHNKLITFGGKTMCISAWAEHAGLLVKTLRRRMKDGWPIDKALTTKSKRK